MILGVPQSAVPTLNLMISGHLDLDRTTTDWLDDSIGDDAPNNLFWSRVQGCVYAPGDPRLAENYHGRLPGRERS